MPTVRRSGVPTVLRQRLAADLAFQAVGIAFIPRARLGLGHLSGATAKNHVSRLLMKLTARDRSQLVVIAYETRLVRVPAD